MDTFISLTLGMLGIMLPAIAFGFILIIGIGIYKLSHIVTVRMANFRLHALKEAGAESDRIDSQDPVGTQLPALPSNWALLAICLFWNNCRMNQAQK